LVAGGALIVSARTEQTTRPDVNQLKRRLVFFLPFPFNRQIYLYLDHACAHAGSFLDFSHEKYDNLRISFQQRMGDRGRASSTDLTAAT